MRSDRLYDARYRQRRRSSPVGAIVGLLIVALITGTVLIGGGAYLGQALIAVAGPDASGDPADTADPALAAATRTARPDATTAPVRGADATAAPAGDPTPLPSRRPRTGSGPAVTTPEPSPVAEEIGGIETDTPVTEPGDAASPEPAPTATPRPWSDLKPKPRKGPFSMDIYKEGAMASEATPAWCVPAAMLTMLNIVKKRKPITSVEEQQRLYNLARRHSTDKLTGLGAEPEGWAEGLNREGIGPYIVHIGMSRRLAVREAAKALRLTGRPVGILAWRGAHSMVLTGFKATADPAWTNDFEVTDVTIADVWWPRVSSIWGTSLPPGTSESFERLTEDFLPWRRPDVPYPKKDGNFILVLPVRDDGRYDPSQDG